MCAGFHLEGSEEGWIDTCDLLCWAVHYSYQLEPRTAKTDSLSSYRASRRFKSEVDALFLVFVVAIH
jgi:hypothetical protein